MSNYSSCETSDDDIQRRDGSRTKREIQKTGSNRCENVKMGNIDISERRENKTKSQEDRLEVNAMRMIILLWM